MRGFFFNVCRGMRKLPDPTSPDPASCLNEASGEACLLAPSLVKHVSWYAYLPSLPPHRSCLFGEEHRHLWCLSSVLDCLVRACSPSANSGLPPCQLWLLQPPSWAAPVGACSPSPGPGLILAIEPNLQHTTPAEIHNIPPVSMQNLRVILLGYSSRTWPTHPPPNWEFESKGIISPCCTFMCPLLVPNCWIPTWYLCHPHSTCIISTF